MHGKSASFSQKWEAEVDLDEYQQKSNATDRGEDLDVYILGLIGEAGDLAAAVKKYKRDAPAEPVLKKSLTEEVGDVLWYVAAIANQFKLSLNEAAEWNIDKTKYLFVDDFDRMDAAAPEEQRFPDKITFKFKEEGGLASITVNGSPFGDALTDNSHAQDGYKFHDVFHLSYMTHLSWSPVIRKLLGRKRRYDVKIDEVEDGARAIFLEEAISLLVFGQSIVGSDEDIMPLLPVENFRPSLFSHRGNVPFAMIQDIKKLTKGVEVKVKSVSQWKDAIAEGYQLFDKLREFGGGYIDCDLTARSMSFRELEA